jgi:hypothetical protein
MEKLQIVELSRLAPFKLAGFVSHQKHAGISQLI